MWVARRPIRPIMWLARKRGGGGSDREEIKLIEEIPWHTDEWVMCETDTLVCTTVWCTCRQETDTLETVFSRWRHERQKIICVSAENSCWMMEFLWLPEIQFTGTKHIEVKQNNIWFNRLCCVRADLDSFICMSLFSAHTVLQVLQRKGAGLNYPHFSFSPPPVYSFHSLWFHSPPPPCLLLCDVIEMQHQALWRAHTGCGEWHPGAAGRATSLVRGWEGWHPVDWARCPPSDSFQSSGREDKSEAHNPRDPTFHSALLFCLNQPPTHIPTPQKTRPSRGGGGGGGGEALHVTECLKLPLPHIVSADYN